MVSSTTSPQIFPRLQPLYTKQPRAISVGTCIGTRGRTEPADADRRKPVKPRILVIALLFLKTFGAWTHQATAETKPTMQKQSFGKTNDGRPVDLYTLTNQNGMEVAITNFGGIIVAL